MFTYSSTFATRLQGTIFTRLLFDELITVRKWDDGVKLTAKT